MRLVILGLAGVDWRGLARRTEASQTPHLASLLKSTLAAPIPYLPPDRGPASWATLATGFPPADHGVIHGDEACFGARRRASRLSLRLPPLWLSLEAAGVRTGGVAWPAAGPGASSPGLHIDERFSEASGVAAENWALPLSCAPQAVRNELRSLRTHPTQITGAMLSPFITRGMNVRQKRNPALPILAAALASATTNHAAATWLLQRTDWDVSFIHYGWLGNVRESFGRAQAPFDSVVDRAWTFLDQLVGRLVSLLRDEDRL
ncbi:MAG: alkaline phosphatase family protein, partial [Caulobacteraceae bacterium]